MWLVGVVSRCGYANDGYIGSILVLQVLLEVAILLWSTDDIFCCVLVVEKEVQ